MFKSKLQDKFTQLFYFLHFQLLESVRSVFETHAVHMKQISYLMIADVVFQLSVGLRQEL
jgi:hypothetical protein